MNGASYLDNISVRLVPMGQSQGRWCDLAGNRPGLEAHMQSFLHQIEQNNVLLADMLVQKA
jgi:hypothetical protein